MDEKSNKEERWRQNVEKNEAGESTKEENEVRKVQQKEKKTYSMEHSDPCFLWLETQMHFQMTQTGKMNESHKPNRH